MLLLAGLLAAGCRRGWTTEEQGHTHLQALRAAGLLGGNRGSTHVLEVRQVTPKDSSLAPAGEAVWWATLQTDDGEAGYLAWRVDGDHALVDFSLEGLSKLELPTARVLDGVPPIQQFPVRGADGKPVASGCVPTAGGSLMAYWSNRGTFDWQADDSHQGLVLRLRDRLPMAALPDLDGYADGKMALAGTSSEALVAGLRADAEQYKVKVAVTMQPFVFADLREEIQAERPVLLTCRVLVPRKPELTWGHAVVAVGYAEVAGQPYVAVIDNFYAARYPGTVRWIAADRCRELICVRPVK